jgi:hypothetical protein
VAEHARRLRLEHALQEAVLALLCEPSGEWERRAGGWAEHTAAAAGPASYSSKVRAAGSYLALCREASARLAGA